MSDGNPTVRTGVIGRNTSPRRNLSQDSGDEASRARPSLVDCEDSILGSLAFETYFEKSLDLLCIADLEGHIVKFNAEWEKALGYERKELEQRPFIDLVHPEDRAATEVAAKTLAQQRPLKGFINRYRHKDGSYRWIEWKSFPQGNLVYSAARDITESRRTEEARLEMERQVQQLRRLESLDAMAGGIAHDFNNLLMAIQGGIELAIADIDVDSSARSLLETSLLAVRKAADLTGQMLTYSGKSHLQLRPTELNELLLQKQADYRALLQPGVEFRTKFASMEALLHIDPDQIHQVILNLVSNATEAIAPQGGLVEITTGLETCDTSRLKANRLGGSPAPGDYAFVEVTDTGCGMEETILARLFEPFFSTKFVGRGLGLSAASGILRAHRGAVFVQSTPGLGSRFRILLPTNPKWMEAPLPRTSSNPPFGATKTRREGPKTILLVDDEPLVLTTCAKALTRAGYKVITASDGIEAIELFLEKKHEIDLGVLDMAMPRLNGVETAERLRGLAPEIPLILSSGYHQRIAGDDIKALGFVDFIQKPYDFGTLRALILRILSTPT